MQRQDQATASSNAALAAGRNGKPRELADWIRRHLFEHLMPFWEQHAMDPHGGILTCIADDGSVLSTDKWLWSQWRAVWIFARLYNTMDRDVKWLGHARHVAEFCLKHGWLEAEQGWALLLAQDGGILKRHESIYTDGFAVYALAELFRAYTVRSERASLFTIGVFSNKYMQYAVGISITMLLLVCAVPFLQPIFNTHFLSGREWSLVVGLALMPAIAEEITKFFLRRSEK